MPSVIIVVVVVIVMALLPEEKIEKNVVDNPSFCFALKCFVMFCYMCVRRVDKRLRVNDTRRNRIN